MKNNEATFIKCTEDLSEGVMFVVRMGETTIEKIFLDIIDDPTSEYIEIKIHEGINFFKETVGDYFYE